MAEGKEQRAGGHGQQLKTFVQASITPIASDHMPLAKARHTAKPNVAPRLGRHFNHVAMGRDVCSSYRKKIIIIEKDCKV